MTLIAAFRCRNNGILLCADRKEDDGLAIREVEKIFHTGFRQFELFMAGAGTITTIKDAWTEITQELYKANYEKGNLLLEHRPIIEACLSAIHLKHKKDLQAYPLGLLIVIQPYQQNSVPALYRTDRGTLIPEGEYAAYGTGRTLADYFAGYLYKHGQADDYLAVLASFIFREAEKSASGVGLGNDMIFICPGGTRKELHTESISQIQAEIPPLADAIQSYWSEHIKVPEWLKKQTADDSTEIR
jgi:20S proteasome alpha/beta subunit